MPQKPFVRPQPVPSLTEPEDVSSNPIPLDDATRDAAAAFEKDWAEQRTKIENSPIMAFIKAHETALTPDEHTICGYAGIKITLGDLKELVAYAG